MLAIMPSKVSSNHFPSLKMASSFRPPNALSRPARSLSLDIKKSRKSTCQENTQTENMAPQKKVCKKKHPQPHTPKKNMIEKWVLIKSSKFSPHFSTFLACYGMCLNVWFHPTTPFFALRECVGFFCQSIHTATGRPCRRAPQTKVGEHHAYQVERQQAAIPLSMSVVWRSILKQFMSFIMVCLEKEALLSSHTVTFPFSSWFYGGSFCIHTSSPHGNWDHPPSARTIM